MTAVLNYTILASQEMPPSETRENTTVFERKVGPYSVQRWLRGFYDRKTGYWYLLYEDWDRWTRDLVDYFIDHYNSEPEVLEFLRENRP